MKQLTCIIAAYNEEPRIGNVLSVLEQCPFVDEVIVVDDGSRDRTADEARKYARTHVISYQPNKGKSHAATKGLRAASGNFIMFLDADLTELKPDDIASLFEPVRSGVSDVSMSLRKNSLSLYRLIGIDFVTGERVLPKSLLMQHIEAIDALPGFGLEIFLNHIIVQNRLRICIVYWDHVINTAKMKKRGFWQGIIAELVMTRQIIRVASIPEIIRQIFELMRLRVNPAPRPSHQER